MPGTIVAPQMTDHECNVLRGYFEQDALMFVAPLASGESAYAGSVMYVDENGYMRKGLPDNTVGMFAWPNSSDFDVRADVGNTQSENMMALPCLGAFELQTTEYDSAQTYAPNDYLTAWDSQLDGYVAANKGQVTLGTPYVNTLVGIVSTGVATNEWGEGMLSLWTYHLPIDLSSSGSGA